jgi:hypothetical protein
VGKKWWRKIYDDQSHYEEEIEINGGSLEIGQRTNWLFCAKPSFVIRWKRYYFETIDDIAVGDVRTKSKIF